MERVESRSFSRVCSWTSSIYIYLNDLFFPSEFTDLCNFADDKTFYACDMDLNSLMKRLEHNNFLAIEWFEIKPR